MRSFEHRLRRYLGKSPSLGKNVYIAKGAVVLGDVAVGDHSSVWFNAVLRGDMNRIAVGTHTNIQDNAVLHIALDLPCIVGDYVTIGHAAVVHACTIGKEVLIGMGATVLDGAIIGEQCIIGANSLVTQGMQVPDGSMVLGSPAKVVRTLTRREMRGLKSLAEHYVHAARYYLGNGIEIGAAVRSK